MMVVVAAAQLLTIRQSSGKVAVVGVAAGVHVERGSRDASSVFIMYSVRGYRTIGVFSFTVRPRESRHFHGHNRHCLPPRAS